MTDAWTPDDVATEHERVADWDAAYVLGALDAEDRRAYERHVATCDRCRDAVAELAGMPGLLALVTADEALAVPPADGAPGSGEAGGGADVVDLGAVAARVRRHQVRRRWTAAAVAAGLLVVGGGAGWGVSQAVSGPDGGPGVSATGTTVDLAPVEGSGVTARVTLQPVGWGTRVAWSCRYDAVPTGPYTSAPYALVLVDGSGRSTTVATWKAVGNGASGLSASTHLPAGDVQAVEIRSGNTVVAQSGD